MNKFFKNTVSKTFDNLGYTIVPNWKLEKYPQSEFIRKLLGYLQIDCIFDVGANEGQFGEFLRQEVGYKGLIVSFEPLPYCLNILNERAIADGNWVVKPYALGSKNEMSKFKIMAGSQFSSFLSPDHSKIDMFTKQNKVLDEIDVEIKKLDDIINPIISEHKVSSLYLKLDTQGYDLEVATGALLSINMFRALQSEASVTSIYEGAPNFEQTIKTFQNLGFDLSGIFPNNPGHFPRMIEFDCHMINKNYIH